MSSSPRDPSAHPLRLAMLFLALLFNAGMNGPEVHADELPAYKGVQWTLGPAKVDLGSVGTMEVPAGFRFTGSQGARIFKETIQSTPNDAVLGILLPPIETQSWHLQIDYRAIGHVKNDDKTSLSDAGAEAILQAIRDRAEAVNQERRRRRWSTIQVQGWEQKPFYDTQTNCLTWAIRVSSENGQVVNYDSCVLGRGGVLGVKMVTGPDQVKALVPTYRMLVSGIQFKSGHRYGEFRAGDKTAQYTLTGLVTGVAIVSGGKLWKFLAPIGLLIAAVLAGIAKKIFGNSNHQAGGTRQAGTEQAENAEQATIVVACSACGRQNRVVANRQETPRCGSCRTPLNVA